MKKYIFLLLSVACLGYAFIQEEHSTAQLVATTKDAAALQTDEPVVTANRGAGVTDVVTAAQAFKALLTTAQINTLQQTYSSTLAHKWSNLPCGSSCRNGLQFSTLTTAQLEAAKAVIKAAAGTVTDEGYDEFMEILSADSLLGTVAGSGYSKGIYFISFLNEPSATGPWMLQFGGHHYAGNIAFNNGSVLGVTPRFEGVEPKTFTAAGGRTMAPIDQEHTAMLNMLSSFSTAQLATAKLTQTFSDVLLGPGQDNAFPATKVGIKVSTLSTAQQQLVLDAMKPWINDADTATARLILAIYQNELANTYVAYSNNATLAANTDYVRIDGPGVWIEFVCQSGVVYQNQIHYHTIWRDHTRDYGADLTGPAITAPATSAISTVKAATPIAIYPNPATDHITIALPVTLSNATMKIINGTTGQTVFATANNVGAKGDIDVSRFAPGHYFVRIEDNNGASYSGRFVKN